MSIFRDIPPTAGFPLSGTELASAYRQRHAGHLLSQDFCDYLGVTCAAITCSGTAALYIICQSLKELSHKRTILLPAFICPLTAFAIKRAGFDILLYDIGERDFNGSSEQVAGICAETNDIAAIVIDHLAGIACDMNRFAQTIREHNLFVIEDCAQSLGALSQGKKVGTLGDFSFFSLAAGKGLTMYEGGVLAANRAEHAAVIAATLKRLVRQDSFVEFCRILELLGYGLFYRPRLFWFVFTLPELWWSMRGDPVKALREDFDIDFPIHSVSGFRQAVCRGACSRIESSIELQREKARRYIVALDGCAGLTIVQEAAGDRAIYPYVTVVFDGPEQKKNALKAFAGSGLGVSQMYALALADYDYLRGMVPDMNSSKARLLAERTITLSTSPFVQEHDLEKTIGLVKTIVR